MDVRALVSQQILVYMCTSSNLILCFHSFITWLSKQAGCEWAADSEHFLARMVISRTSILHSSRPVRHRPDDELVVDKKDEK